MSSRRSGRTSGVAATAAGSQDSGASPEPTARHPARPGGRRAERFEGGEIMYGKRNRGGKKSYVIDSSPDDEEEEEEEAELDDDAEDDEDDMDAEGEDEMDVDVEGEDVDAEGEEDAEGDIDMDPAPVSRTIKVSRPSINRSAPRAKVVVVGGDGEEEEEEEEEDVDDDDGDDDDDEDEENDDDEDDEELSDPGESDPGEETLVVANDTMADGDDDGQEDDDGEDAEGEEIQVAGEQEEVIDDHGTQGKDDLDSERLSRAETPDINKMTKRQRARFEDEPQQYMKLPDEVQSKKQYTAEELSMRRQEMARRRRNLSEKRNEEVKMETVNKLLKKQAPKINRKTGGPNADASEDDARRHSPAFIRWVSSKNGSRLAVTEEMLASPAGQVFTARVARAPSANKEVQRVA